MPVGKQKPRLFYSISREGKVRHKDSQSGTETLYDFIEGYLVRIDLQADEYEGQKQWKYYFYFEDEDHSQTEILQVGEASSATRNIILSLMSVEGPIGWVYLRPYVKRADDGKDYTNVYFEHNHQKNEEGWKQVLLDKMPKTEEVKIGEKTYIDDTERRKYFRSLVAKIKKTKLNADTPEDYSHQSSRGGVEDIGQTEGEMQESADLGREYAPPPDDDDLMEPARQAVYSSSPGSTIKELRRKLLILQEGDEAGLWMDVKERDSHIEIINEHLAGKKQLTQDTIKALSERIEAAMQSFYKDNDADDDLPF